VPGTLQHRVNTRGYEYREYQLDMAGDRRIQRRSADKTTPASTGCRQTRPRIPLLGSRAALDAPSDARSLH